MKVLTEIQMFHAKLSQKNTCIFEMQVFDFGLGIAVLGFMPTDDEIASSELFPRIERLR